MTERPIDTSVVIAGPDPVLEPGQQLLVTSRRGRELFPRGLGTIVLAVIVAMLCSVIALLLIRASAADRQRLQLACQVQRLGGQPVGGVNCPKPKISARPVTSPSRLPSPDVIVVQPPPSVVFVRPVSPSSAAQPRRTTAPSPKPSSTRRPSTSPSPTCSPLPVLNRCLG